MRAVFDEQELKELKTLLEKEADLTLSEIKEHFGKTCSLVTVHKTVVKLGFAYKKMLKVSQQEQPDIIEARRF